MYLLDYVEEKYTKVSEQLQAIEDLLLAAMQESYKAGKDFDDGFVAIIYPDKEHIEISKEDFVENLGEVKYWRWNNNDFDKIAKIIKSGVPEPNYYYPEQIKMIQNLHERASSLTDEEILKYAEKVQDVFWNLKEAYICLYSPNVVK